MPQWGGIRAGPKIKTKRKETKLCCFTRDGEVTMFLCIPVVTDMQLVKINFIKSVGD